MKLLDFLFPRKCILCRTILKTREQDLCPDCQKNSPWFLGGNGQELTLRFLDRFHAVWYYDGNVRRSVLRYKFHRGLFLARPFGRRLAAVVHARGLKSYDAICWVPVSRRRKWKRGYDQSYLLAREMGRELGIRPSAFLKKVHHNPAQSGISGKARRGNVLGVYQVKNPPEVGGKHILLVDDIVTTGATADECAKVLKGAGAKSVTLIAIAAATQKMQKGE